MMHRSFMLIISFVVIISQISCSEPDPIDEPLLDPVALENDINDFVWKGMNEVYFWQQDVPNLSDRKNDIQDDYFTYLNGFSAPENLFESLLYQKGVEDRFSWFVEDYKVKNESDRGVSDSFGFEFDLARLCEDCNEVIGYILYVLPNSPASDAGLKRGDVFYIFNGTELTVNNYTVVNAYYNDSNISMGFGTLEDGNIVSNNIEASLSLREVVDNPIFYSDIITNNQGTKVGYFVYNAFRNAYHEELNAVFSTFKTENIQELILDLRYNGGGSGETAAYLASMIFGNAPTTEPFAKFIYNSKNSSDNAAYPFYDMANIYSKDGYYEITGTETINKLTNLSKLYVITSDQTASASELVINGLSPYMEVIKIGTTTYGKNVGSYTVYDSPDFTINNANKNHSNAIQPISIKIFNKLDQSDYALGFTPDYEVIDYISEMKGFGDLDETLLKAALDIISGNAAKVQSIKKPKIGSEIIFKSLQNKPFSKDLYIEPFN